MSRYGNLGSFDYRVTNVPQYDLEADLDRSLKAGIALGSQIGEGIRQNRYTEADKIAARQTSIANQLAIDKVDASQREGLILKADDDAGSLNETRIDFSNMLVDRLNQAKIARDSGAITAADYSKVVTTLEAQIPAYKAGEKVLYSYMADYMASVENGNQSKANNPESIQFLSAMSTGRANVDWTFDENNKMQLTGTWTDTEGKEHPIEAALSKLEQLPHVYKAPENTAFEQRQADIASLQDTQQGTAMTRVTSKTDPVTGMPMFESTINPLFTETTEMVTTRDGKKVKASRTIDQIQPWFRQAAEDSFNGYFDSLGEGDLRMGLKEYLLDSTQSGLGYAEVSSLIDGSKDKDGNIIKNTIPTLDVLKQIKEDMKEEYMFEMLDETQKANELKVEKLKQNYYGDSANVASDKIKIMNAKNDENELRKKAASGKEDSKTKSNSNELTDIYNTILSTPIENDLSTDTVLSGPTPYIERIKPVLSKYNYYIDVDEEGNFLLGKAGMKDQKKKRKIDPSRVQNIGLLMEEIAALNNEKWSTPQPIIVK